MEMEYQVGRKPRFLCFHGYRTSGKILERELQRWPEFVREKMELVFIDAPFPAQGPPIPPAAAEGNFDPPYYEWFQSNEDFSEYMNFDECIAYIEDCMTRIGPFDGLLGFSQGALLSAALPGMQTEGVVLTRVPKIKCVIIISGGKFGGSKFSSPKLAENAFSSPIECPSLHFIGEKDLAKPYAIELLDPFVDPFVIFHHEGHVVPKLDEKGLEVMLSFLEKIQKLL
ncbi:esterase C25G4.2-like isoform X1 [Camellia sinensis]|uniref:esterase C25G4.2-like isoform X1 n=1 Tax=Camellia sinensis TaxID=4442 RepID=UPI0010361EE7|nr:esterase C25G4.2-like isoform X1 [Camellia sinensis]